MDHRPDNFADDARRQIDRLRDLLARDAESARQSNAPADRHLVEPAAKLADELERLKSILNANDAEKR